MDRREFLAAGAAIAFGGCVAVPAESRPTAFTFDDFARVTDVEVGGARTVFVGGRATDGAPRVVELDEEGGRSGASTPTLCARTCTSWSSRS